VQNSSLLHSGGLDLSELFEEPPGQPLTLNHTLKMHSRKTTFLLSAALTCLAATTGWSQVGSYSQDFEGLDQANPAALGDDGWLVGANVFDPNGNWLYNYFAFPAPNGGAGFCAIAAGEGGSDQGAQQMVVYNDYNNGDHANGNLIEANVFQERVIAAADVGKNMVFSFDGKLGDLQAPTTASAFIKVLNTNTWGLDAFLQTDMTGAPTTWSSHSMSLTIDPGWVGFIFQVGFMNTATNWTASGVVYDNVSLGEAVAEPGAAYCFGDGMGSACPCGNSGNAGEGCANGTGSGGLLTASGSASVSADDLAFEASGLTDGPGLFFQGDNAINGGMGTGFGDGLRCAGGKAIRLEVVFSSGGSSATTISIATKGEAESGDTKRYQLWYRDTDTSPCGNTFNLTNGYEVTWSA